MTASAGGFAQNAWLNSGLSFRCRKDGVNLMSDLDDRIALLRRDAGRAGNAELWSALTDAIHERNEYRKTLKALDADKQEKMRVEIGEYRRVLKLIKDQAEIEGAYKQDSAFPYIANLAGDALSETTKDKCKCSDPDPYQCDQRTRSDRVACNCVCHGL